MFLSQVKIIGLMPNQYHLHLLHLGYFLNIRTEFTKPSAIAYF